MAAWSLARSPSAVHAVEALGRGTDAIEHAAAGERGRPPDHTRDSGVEYDHGLLDATHGPASAVHAVEAVGRGSDAIERGGGGGADHAAAGERGRPPDLE